MTRPAAGWRLALGIGQVALATATLLAWLLRAPAPLELVLLLATGLLVLVSCARWHRR